MSFPHIYDTSTTEYVRYYIKAPFESTMPPLEVTEHRALGRIRIHPPLFQVNLTPMCWRSRFLWDMVRGVWLCHLS